MSYDGEQNHLASQPANQFTTRFIPHPKQLSGIISLLANNTSMSKTEPFTSYRYSKYLTQIINHPLSCKPADAFQTPTPVDITQLARFITPIIPPPKPSKTSVPIT